MSVEGQSASATEPPAAEASDRDAKLAELARKARERRAAKKAKAEGKPGRASAPASSDPVGPVGEEEEAASTQGPSELHTALAQFVWGVAGQVAAGTRYSIEGDALAPVVVKGKLTLAQRPKAELLVEASIPVLAKYLPGGDASPELALALMVGMVFGPAAIEHWREIQAAKRGVAKLRAAPKDEAGQEATGDRREAA